MTDRTRELLESTQQTLAARVHRGNLGRATNTELIVQIKDIEAALSFDAKGPDQ